jgi:uncharacterized protein (TIGR02145 family)
MNADCPTDPVTDIEGTVYTTVAIGTQVWMIQNLKTMTYNDGISIPNETIDATWAALTTPAYCWYNNHAATYKATYGALYNWYTVNTGKLCPAGWHVPTDAEWTTLTDYLGGLSLSGGKLKEMGTIHWISPNVSATNESGFTALPCGIRHSNGIFDLFGISTQVWSATESDTNNAWNYGLDNIYANTLRASDFKWMGQSVRCVRD